MTPPPGLPFANPRKPKPQPMRENEELERKEEEAALAQRMILDETFEDVKTEFFELDGLQWPARPWALAREPTARPLPQRPGPLESCISDTPTIRPGSENTPSICSPVIPSTPPCSPRSALFVQLSAVEDTIRVSRLARRPSLPPTFASEAHRRRRDSYSKRKANRRVSADQKWSSEAASPTLPLSVVSLAG
ncbi:hypothetical protein FA95DRAFT_1601621 [Auriscalpium vulgare]|uniref:Uncharacterized protein n=1 Tax=Auriscalpium vulgare TaxID=40419 RepID=A0ACB8S9I9_9AGAM|nr:hypothetical protein FA95DRAFT_1601621 [Auriscalpium vulgare]